jgi:dUTP pyrophosphatase
MTNIGNLSTTINKGDKIAQLVIAPVPMIDWVEVEELSPTERGEGGFGSTDKK